MPTIVDLQQVVMIWCHLAPELWSCGCCIDCLHNAPEVEKSCGTCCTDCMTRVGLYIVGSCLGFDLARQNSALGCDMSCQGKAGESLHVH
jgi:hypothetical protein